ncbi:hypothetical protein BDW02DRAFT_608701 [Decorospora gaudefroyi]|uniref:Uncharacterized protein n=1 Tax=Decorospora gaudefroyi TaxID=184978 RepID=A0A6A5JZ84_9PLEO|nr:hypothetical protein BDW02DRAFT_608701 [Decorospora gaudefroyi]
MNMTAMVHFLNLDVNICLDIDPKISTPMWEKVIISVSLIEVGESAFNDVYVSYGTRSRESACEPNPKALINCTMCKFEIVSPGPTARTVLQEMSALLAERTGTSWKSFRYRTPGKRTASEDRASLDRTNALYLLLFLYQPRKAAGLRPYNTILPRDP